MNCYKCLFRGTVPGSAHSKCKFPGTKNEIFDFFAPDNQLMRLVLKIQADIHGIKNGWCMWPVDFDPRWITNCWGFVDKDNPNLSHLRFVKMVEVYEKGEGRFDPSVKETLDGIIKNLHKVVELTKGAEKVV